MKKACQLLSYGQQRGFLKRLKIRGAGDFEVSRRFEAKILRFVLFSRPGDAVYWTEEEKKDGRREEGGCVVKEEEEEEEEEEEKEEEAASTLRPRINHPSHILLIVRVLPMRA